MGSSKSSKQELRHAPHLEAVHKQLLANNGLDTVNLSVVAAFNAALNKSPYGDYIPPNVEQAFFGEGYEIKNFPSMFDMFGKFVAGLDICTLYNQIYENVVHSDEVSNAIAAHSALLSADVESESLPRFLAGMRDINAVHASSFMIGKALIEDGRMRLVDKLASELRLKTVDASIKVWERHLDWNKAVIQSYGEVFKLYFSARTDIDRDEMEYRSKDELWNLGLFEYTRAMLGALGGGGATSAKNEPSQVSKSIGGALSGAAAGAMIASGTATGGPVGAVIGGVLGLAASFF